MKKHFFTLAVITIGILVAGFFAFSFRSPSSAQRKQQNQWEYAAITYTTVPFNSENQPFITAVANVCFLQQNGCRNEEIKAELVYAKFLQDFRLENTFSSKNLGNNRARELVFTKAVARLGSEGWEMMGEPSVNFDNYILDAQGSYAISLGNKEIKPNIYFKRMIQ
jgi:hypothetical protein